MSIAGIKFKKGDSLFVKLRTKNKLDKFEVIEMRECYLIVESQKEGRLVIDKQGQAWGKFDGVRTIVGSAFVSEEEYENKSLNSAFIKFQNEVYGQKSLPDKLTMERLNKARNLIFG